MDGLHEQHQSLVFKIITSFGTFVTGGLGDLGGMDVKGTQIDRVRTDVVDDDRGLLAKETLFKPKKHMIFVLKQ